MELKLTLMTTPLMMIKLLKLYQHGDTIGTFQFESPGMQNICVN
jgi:DNA polymerase III alpha subunit